jgi:beta-lactamase regulating signal transducer with metallopeptidase domain
MFGLYWILLRQVKLFRFTRFFLLFAILLSLVLPFISISVNLFNSEVQKSNTSIINSIVPLFNAEKNIDHFNLNQPTEVIPSWINLSQILILLYILGIIIFLFRFLKNIFFISQQIKLSEKVSLSGRRLALIDTQINPYCFFNTIFVNKHDYLTNKIERELLSHEIEHIRQFHSFDIIFIEIIQIIYWFNPLLLLYNRAIRINHEFLADNNAIRDFSDIKSYSEILINFIGSKSNIPLTTGFYQSLTKKRLLMLTKSNPSRVTASFRFLMTSILVVAFTLLLSFKNSDSKPLTDWMSSENSEIGSKFIENITVNQQNKSSYLQEQKEVSDKLLRQRKSFLPDTIMTEQEHIQNVTEKDLKYSSSGYIKRDQINKKITLIQGAILTFGDIVIRADSIVIDMNKDQIFAAGRTIDGSISGKPYFKEGNNSIEADEITFNFKTHRALAKKIIVPKEIAQDTVMFSNLVLHIDIGNKKNNLLVQLIDDKENIVKTQTIDATGKCSFSLIKEGKYNLRAIFDLNNNGKYEPQMDSVSYFPRKLEIKAGWDIVQDWDLRSVN